MGAPLYIVMFRLNGQQVIRSRHRSERRALNALRKYRKACERQPAAHHELYIKTDPSPV
jgi:hypothetical protein